MRFVRVAAAAVLVLALVAACSAAMPEASTLARFRDDDALSRASTADDGGVRYFGEVDGGSRTAVQSDAGVASAESAWLAAHLADDPDRVDSSDSPNTRALAARGPDGVRAVMPVFARADTRRVRFARRVLERVARRACGRDGRDDTVRLLEWLEHGHAREAGAEGAWRVQWLIVDEVAWPRDALARLSAWADAGVPCTRPSDPSTVGRDGGLRTDAAVDGR